MQFGRTLIDSFTDDLHENEFVVETHFHMNVFALVLTTRIWPNIDLDRILQAFHHECCSLTSYSFVKSDSVRLLIKKGHSKKDGLFFFSMQMKSRTKFSSLKFHPLKCRFS